MAVIAVWSPFDIVLGIVAPLGLAVHAGTALVVDLDPGNVAFHSEDDLASLVRRGPTEAQLQPKRRGVAVLSNGGVTVSEASEVVSALAQRWPNLVLRCAPEASSARHAIGIVPILPDPFAVAAHGDVVYQRTNFGGEAAPGAVVLPVPRRSTIGALLSGHTPVRRDRWIGSLSAVWAMA